MKESVEAVGAAVDGKMLAEVWEGSYAWSRPTAKRLRMTGERLGASPEQVEGWLLEAGLMRRCVACGKTFPFNKQRRGGVRCDRDTCKLRKRVEAVAAPRVQVLIDPATPEEAVLPTTHAPGTPGKLGVLQMRASMGLALFLDGDGRRLSKKATGSASAVLPGR